MLCDVETPLLYRVLHHSHSLIFKLLLICLLVEVIFQKYLLHKSSIKINTLPLYLKRQSLAQSHLDLTLWQSTFLFKIHDNRQVHMCWLLVFPQIGNLSLHFHSANFFRHLHLHVY